ncbi:snaclec subunit A [Erythrolamprus reginae]|uniref:snaclec subunit A n=1 Tax=Erythrolamprus reginae TaxID=121349 RepID=UPI00396C3961
MGRFIFVSLGLLVVAFSLRGSGACCPCGWSSYDKYCYKVFDKRKNWDDAERFCMEQGKGGHLASLGSMEEGNFVSKLALNRLKKEPTYVWIGLRAQGQEQQCSSRWSDGSRIGYENWHPLQSRKCLTLSNWTEYLKWHNYNCDFTLPFICKFLAEPDDPE